MGQIQQALQSARQDIAARLSEIQTQLRQLSSQLKQAKQTLASLRSNPNANPNSISAAEKQVKDTQSKIDKLKSEQSQQTKASRSLGVDGTLPGAGDVAAADDRPE